MLSEEEKKAIAHLEWLLDDGILASEDEPYIETILNLIEKQQAEKEKKDKIINKMADALDIAQDRYEYMGKERVIEYFTNKIEEER